MTGYATQEDRMKSREAGFDGHLVKPVMPAELLGLILASRRSG
jgi:CheY-like chemotaxis protein